jgi:hypothetical protein
MVQQQQTPARKPNPLVIAAIVVGTIVMLCGMGGMALVLGDHKAKPSGAKSAGIPPKPDAATQAAYVAALDAIDPDIVHGNPDQAVSRGRDTCASISDYKAHKIDGQELNQLTVQRFTSPNHPDGFGTAKAAEILAAVRQHICRAY